MTAILQLNPPWHVLTPKGEGFARALIDYGPDLNPIFLVDLWDTRDCICIDMREIRFGANAMWDLPAPQPFTERRA